jgi:hypothetical protein
MDWQHSTARAQKQNSAGQKKEAPAGMRGALRRTGAGHGNGRPAARLRPPGRTEQAGRAFGRPVRAERQEFIMTLSANTPSTLALRVWHIEEVTLSTAALGLSVGGFLT